MHVDLTKIKQRVTGAEKKGDSDFDLMYWADLFMHEYGMSFEEFRNLKIPTFFGLQRAMEKSKRIGWEQMLIQFMKSFSKSNSKRNR